MVFQLQIGIQLFINYPFKHLHHYWNQRYWGVIINNTAVILSIKGGSPCIFPVIWERPLANRLTKISHISIQIRCAHSLKNLADIISRAAAFDLSSLFKSQNTSFGLVGWSLNRLFVTVLDIFDSYHYHNLSHRQVLDQY